MRIPRFAIENHQFTIVIFALLVISGIVSSLTMPKTEDPNVQPPGSSVVVIYPGANPADIEQQIINPLEEAINELDDIRTLHGYARGGIGIVDVEFLPGNDPDDKYDKVLQKVNSTRGAFPDAVLSLETIKWSISDVQILQLALVSETASYAELETEAERLEKALERIHGVKQVSIWALPEQQVRVELDTEKLARWHIPLSRIAGAIQAANANIPGGYVDAGGTRLNIKTSGSYGSLREIGKTVVHSANGNLVYLRDLAGISRQPEDPTYIARTNGERCIYLSAGQKPGTNIFSIYREIRPILDEFRNRLPANMGLRVVFDQSESVAARISDFFINLLQGIVLVGLVVFSAIGFRAASVVMMAVPISILIAIGFVDISGYGLQQMSIAGLVIALGLLVDNAIVVTENSERFMRLGQSPKDAAVQGTSQIAWAIISATATTVLAFIPIILMRDVTGDFIRSMPVTVIYTLIVSLFISLTLTPYLSVKFLRVSRRNKPSRIRRFLDWFIAGPYRRTLDFALSHPFRIVLAVLIVFFLSLGVFPFVGVSFFPKAEKPQFFVDVDLPPGSSLLQTDKLTRRIEKIIAENPEVKTVASNVGTGNPSIYYNIHGFSENSSRAQIYVELQSRDKEKYASTIKSLRQNFSAIPGAKIALRELEQGPPIESAISVRIIGENLEVLKTIATDVEQIIELQSGTVNVDNPFGTSQSQLAVKINREKAAMLGIALSEIDRVIRLSIAGMPVSTYQNPEGDVHDIVLRLPLKGTPGIPDLDRVYIPAETGAMVPLRQVASVELSGSPRSITHYAMERTVFIRADVLSGYSTDEISQRIIGKLNAYSWPQGYRYSMGGVYESQGTSFSELTQAIIIALIAIFGVLVLQFRSYIQPFIVFSAIPFAVIGSILALFVTGNSFSFSAFIGLTSLVGIVVNNSIILVDYTNQLRADGVGVISALKEAGQVRFTPIVLTTATTIGGLLPLTLTGGSLWQPMGWTIIGGLITSTFLTLVLVPVLYKMFARDTAD